MAKIELRTLEPRSGKRLPVGLSNEEKKIKEQKIELKNKEEEQDSEIGDQDIEGAEGEEEENSQQQEDVEAKRKEANSVNLVPPSNIQNIIQQNNVIIDSVNVGEFLIVRLKTKELMTQTKE